MKLKKYIIIWLIVVILFSGLPIGAVVANQGIWSYDQVKDLEDDADIDDEIVIIYQNDGSVKDLGLTTSQIEAGEKLNDQVDIIKVKDGNQVDALVSVLLKNPHVLAAQKNACLKFAALPNDPKLAKAWQFEAIGANQGWQDFVENGTLSGTTGESLRLEAIKIELTGADADLFDIYYQVHVQNIGWMDWTLNGEPAGTEGFGYRLEGIRIQVGLKGSEAQGKVERPYLKQ